MSRTYPPRPRRAPTAAVAETLSRLVATARKHRAPLGVAAGVVMVAGATLGGVLALTGASAEADVPPASNGRLLTVRVETRTAPEPQPTVAYSLLPTLAAPSDQPVATDPDLASAQAADDVQRYLDAESRQQAAAMAALARADRQAARTMRDAPTWPNAEIAPAPAADAATPG